MSGTQLLLGPILFSDFEVPEGIFWGGRQRLAVHVLPGGARVIDAMGRDDASVRWAGVFSGADAAERARALDLMRAEGGVWPLTWDAFFYSVIIARFDAVYTRPNWIPYEISVTVLRDEAEAVFDAVLTLGTSVLGDLSAAQGLGSGLDLSDATSALLADGATTRGSANYAGATAVLGAAASGVETQIATADTALPTQPTIAPGPLGSAIDAAGTLAALTGARGFVLRARNNLLNAGT